MECFIPAVADGSVQKNKYVWTVNFSQSCIMTEDVFDKKERGHVTAILCCFSAQVQSWTGNYTMFQQSNVPVVPEQ